MDNRKTILHAIPWIGLRGSEKTCLNVAKYNPQYKHVFVARTVVSDEALAEFSAVGDVVVDDKMTSGGFFDYTIVTDDYVRANGIDLAVIYLPGDTLPPYVKRLSCKKIVHVLCTKLCQFDTQHFDLAVVPSQFAATLNPHLSPVVAYPPVEKRFPSLSKLDVISKYFGRDLGENTILVSRIGSIEEVKHIEDFLKIAKSYEHVDNMLFLYAGVGDTRYVNALASHYQGKNIVYAGVVSEQEKADINAASYVCLYPTEFEAFGYSLVEPMSHGVPVITYNETACSETVSGGGVAVEFKDLNAMAIKLAEIVARPFFRQQLSISAHKRWVSSFSPEVASAAYAEIYEKVLDV